MTPRYEITHVLPGSRSAFLAVLRGRSFGAPMRSSILRRIPTRPWCTPWAGMASAGRPAARFTVSYGTAMLS